MPKLCRRTRAGRTNRNGGKPMTRAEYIRSIPIEELAQIIIDKNITDEFCKSDCGSEDDCPHEKDCCIRWLNEDVGGLR